MLSQVVLVGYSPIFDGIEPIYILRFSKFVGPSDEDRKPKQEVEDWDAELKINPGQSYDPELRLKENRGRMIQ